MASIIIWSIIWVALGSLGLTIELYNIGIPKDARKVMLMTAFMAPLAGPIMLVVVLVVVHEVNQELSILEDIKSRIKNNG